MNAKEARRLASMDRSTVIVYEQIRARACNRHTSLSVTLDTKVIDTVLADLKLEGYVVVVNGHENSTRKELLIDWSGVLYVL